MNLKISYAVTVCNESEELKRLLSFLFKHKRECDEVVVQADKNKVTKKVKDVVSSFSNTTFIEHPFTGSFSEFKNHLTKQCAHDYIFQIDADEIPSIETVENLHKILEANVDSDLFLVPRINTVEGLTKEHVDKWKWNVDDNGRVNWPDYQYRIYKNRFYIKWVNDVHEVIDGAQVGIRLPAEDKFALTHEKTISKQEKQNEFYETIG
tara:strand:+ start:50 stop:673 length:624 start_codon:yes stop_codon:yes gene_type:complete